MRLAEVLVTSTTIKILTLDRTDLIGLDNVVQ